ncbi:MAG TPA: hypothetical protein VFW44_19995 [Bryobacteraceae bacterium]|nr:hypothetical protein [Bryobacteraceae bacterium]
MLLVILASDAVAQSRPPVLTVCEVLADFQRLANKPVIIVGRMESIVGDFDRSDFLSEDLCEHPIVMYGHTWDTKIQLWSGSRPGMPAPPSDSPKLDPMQLANKAFGGPSDK